MDKLSPSQRSAHMARIRRQDTKPELLVRQITHGLGYRYRLHRRDLPGTPDLVFPSRRKVIFVHGCFWHQHADADCRLARLPQARPDYWLPKLLRNQARDMEQLCQLKHCGWDVLVLWECELRDQATVASRIASFLGPVGKAGSQKKSTS